MWSGSGERSGMGLQSGEYLGLQAIIIDTCWDESELQTVVVVIGTADAGQAGSEGDRAQLKNIEYKSQKGNKTKRDQDRDHDESQATGQIQC